MEKINDKTYSYIRGFNYFASNVTFSRDVIELYDDAIWDRELGYAEQFKANTLRIWFDIDSFMRDERLFIETFGKILNKVKAHGMKMMPVLYNCWLDLEHPFGALYPQDVYSNNRKRHYDYLQSVVGMFANDPTIVMWDLCNEPYSFGWNEKCIQQETDFWLDLIACFRKINPSQPLTMGTHRGPSSFWGLRR